ncbi:MAG TPA: hypothetical protein DCR55_01770, partial [Lentisphaeria bacterium]|nr:hypothetical protein [Lentisphaeria bacterium]
MHRNLMPKFTAVVLLLAIAWTVSAAHDWDGSPVLPVHRIPLHDEDGVKILSDAENAKPISARATCIQCHDYDAIQTGWHFSSEGDLEGRATEPWVMVDEKSGTQLPISRRGAAGTWAPEHLGMSDWDFIKQFARHMPGGGPGEGERAAADPDSRWTVSGDLEINCFVCHNTGPHQDMTEWVKQIARENFRWAATAAACLGEVSGMAARLPATWNPSDGPDPDDLIIRVPPSVTYPETLFDSKDRVVLDLGKPTDARCIQCHAVAEVGKAKHHVTGDIHTRAGMDCISCHSNGIDHKIDRGSTGAFSCAGCHGLEDSEADIGSYGAPIPEHKGLPPIHLEKMACTACHSGVAIDHGPSLVRTSKINRLGIHGRAQWMIEAPQILEPIFKRDGSGKIAPHRMMWPAFWARSSGDDLKPLDAQDVMAQSSDILDPAMVVASVLSRLGKIKDQDGYAYGQPVFVSDGIVYQSTADGGLDQHPYNGEIPGAFRFGYIVDNALLPIAEPYDAEEENGFYYLDESRQEHVISVLTALAEIAPDGTTPAWILGSKLHRLQNVEYALLPAEGFAQLKQDAEKAKVAVTTLATKLDVATEVDGTKQKFYRKSDKTELKASRSKTPELYKLKVLMKEQRKAEAKLSELEVIGDKAYRNTFQKNTSQYPVIEEFKGTSNTAWGWVKDDQAQPLVPDYVGAFVTATGGGDTVAFTEKQIAMALEKLGEDVVYVSGGKVFSRNADG